MDDKDSTQGKIDSPQGYISQGISRDIHVSHRGSLAVDEAKGRQEKPEPSIYVLPGKSSLALAGRVLSFRLILFFLCPLPASEHESLLQ